MVIMVAFLSTGRTVIRRLATLEPLVFLVLMLGASLWYARPFLGSQLVPCMDSPAHLALVSAMHHLGQPDHILAQTFRWGEFPAPNSAYYLIAYLLGTFLDMMLVERIIVLLWVIGLPWAFYYFATAFGRDKWLSFVAFPLVMMWPFTEGFLDYCLGSALTLAGLGLVRRYLVRRTAARTVGVFLLSGVVFLAHIQALVYYGVGIAILLILAAVQRFRRSGGWSAALSILRDSGIIASLGLVLVVSWLLGSGQELFGEVSAGDLTEIDLQTKLTEMWTHTVLVLGGTRDAWNIVFLLVAGGVFGWTVRVFGQDEGGATRSERAILQVPLLLLLVLTATYAVLPLDFGLYYNLHSRVPAFLMLLAACLLAPAGTGPARKGIGVLAALPLLAVVAYTPYAWSFSFEKLDAFATGFWEVLKTAPEQSRLLYYVERSPTTGFDSRVCRHLGQYHTVVNQGVGSYSFADHPGRLIVQQRLGNDIEPMTSRALVRQDLHTRYDVLLQYGGTPLEQSRESPFRLLTRLGEWSLYRIVSRAPAPDEGLVATVGGGGPGGGTMVWNCPIGQALVGVDGRLDRDAIGGLRPRCRPLDRILGERRGRGETSGPSFGNYHRGERFSVGCPEGQVVVGMYGRTGTVVHQIGFYCAAVTRQDDELQLGAPERQERSAGRESGATFDQVCPEGTLAAGLRGRSGALVDAFHIACFPLDRALLTSSP